MKSVNIFFGQNVELLNVEVGLNTILCNCFTDNCKWY
jgi:hypothetical protein